MEPKPDNPDQSSRRQLLLGTVAVGASSLAFAAVPIGATGAAHAADPAVPELTVADMIGKTLRVYHTGDAVTMDYSEDRLNIELGPDERIVRVSVG